MTGTDSKQKTMTRRSLVFAGMLTLPFAALFGRLYALQIVAGHKYKRLSEANRIAVRLTLPARGLIKDKEGKILAENFKAFRLAIVPERAHNPADILRRVSRLIELPAAAQQHALEKITKNPKFMAIPVKDFLSFSEVARLQVNLPDIPGVEVQEILARQYPHKTLAAHVIGFMGPVARYHQKNSDDPLLRQPDFRIGRQGAEAYFDERLRGKAGTDHVEVNARGREVRVISKVPSQAGQDVSLTLVTPIQKAAEKSLGDYRGAVSLMDVQNGHILAMASRPVFDPEKFVYGLGNQAWDRLQRRPEKPLLNRCCQGRYPPGSTFKMIVALAALEEGLITPEQEIECTGKMYFGDRYFHCWERDGHGRMNMHKAIAESCDIYFYELGRLLGIEKIKMYALKLGLGQKTGVFLPEDAGFIPDRNWKKQAVGENWQKGEDLIAAIGQGYILTTPQQLATMTARLATGRMVQPTFIPQASDSNFPLLPFKKRHLAIVRRAMVATVTKPYGTAYASRLTRTAYGGKTGTSQVVSKRFDKDIDISEIAEQERTHALFTAFGPAESPRFALSILLENAGSGSRAAAPAGRDVFLAALRWMRSS